MPVMQSARKKKNLLLMRWKVIKIITWIKYIFTRKIQILQPPVRLWLKMQRILPAGIESSTLQKQCDSWSWDCHVFVH